DHRARGIGSCRNAGLTLTTPTPGADVIPLLLAYILAAVVAPPLMRVLGRKGFLVLSLIPAATAAWALVHTRDVLAGRGPRILVEWAPSLGMHLDFRLDGLAWLMTLLVGGI